MRKKRANRTLLARLPAYIVLLVVFAFFAGIVLQMLKPPVVSKFELSEISDGVYVYRENIVSSVPAHNYAMATVCDTSGNIYTIRGTVKIVNYDYGTPYAVLEDCNMVNSDTITLYVPSGTVQYIGTTTVGRK